LPRPAPPVHRGAAGRDPATRRAGRAAARDPGQRPGAHRVAAGLPLPPALPLRLGPVRERRAGPVRRGRRAPLALLAGEAPGAARGPAPRRGAGRALSPPGRGRRCRGTAGGRAARGAAQAVARGTGRREGRRAMSTPDPANAAAGAEDAGVRPSAHDLPPAKGDSDLGGRTAEEVPPPEDALLDVRGLVKHFPLRRGLFGRVRGHVRAVDGISFWLRRGETLGLVGESGSGKTTAGRTILRLIEPTGGSAFFEGRDVFRMDPRELRRF